VVNVTNPGAIIYVILLPQKLAAGSQPMINL